MPYKKCIVFIVGSSVNRDGIQKDIGNITKTFKELFKAEIYNWTDLDKNNLTARLKDLTEDSWREAFKKIDFIVTFCLAHGREEDEAVFPNLILPLRKILLPPFFQIKELDGKLKWLIVQTCRGKLNPKPMQRDGKKGYYTDFHFISYCTGDGTQSWQEGRSGKIYIEKICEELQKNAKELSLFEIMKLVNTRVEKYGKGLNLPELKPEPFMQTNCENDFYFYTKDEDEQNV